MTDDIIIYANSFDSVSVRSDSDCEWVPPSSLDSSIDEIWESKLNESQSDIYNSNLKRLVSYDEFLTGTYHITLHLDLANTDYKNHVGTRTNSSVNSRANPLFVSANILTSDDYLVFARNKYAERGTGEYNIVAKSVTSKDLEDNLKLGGIIRNAINSKLGISDELIDGTNPSILFGLNSEPSPSLLYTVELNVPKSYVESTFNTHLENNKSQFDNLLFIHVNDLYDDLESVLDENKFRPMVYAELKEQYSLD